jgi:hypothetical protein
MFIHVTEQKWNEGNDILDGKRGRYVRVMLRFRVMTRRYPVPGSTLGSRERKHKEWKRKSN